MKSKLEELSTKSLEGPERLVEKESSNTLAAIISMALIPSRIVFPGASAPEIVADA